LRAGLVGYYRMLRRERDEGRRMNRSAKEGNAGGRKKKLLGAAIWFTQRKKRMEEEKRSNKGWTVKEKKKRKQVEGNNNIENTEAVLFILMTLARELQKKEDIFSKLHKTPRIRMVEKVG